MTMPSLYSDPAREIKKRETDIRPRPRSANFSPLRGGSSEPATTRPKRSSVIPARFVSSPPTSDQEGSRPPGGSSSSLGHRQRVTCRGNSLSPSSRAAPATTTSATSSSPHKYKRQLGSPAMESSLGSTNRYECHLRLQKHKQGEVNPH